MYAIIESGGHQHRVRPGMRIKLARLTAEEGQSVGFEQVLMISTDAGLRVGAPHVAGAQVKATVISHGRDKKVHILKFKRRKHHMKRMGHRQDHTIVMIEAIEEGK